jgi:hypothetical protein
MKIEFRKLTRNGRDTNFISVTGSETLTISAVAQQLCVQASSVIRDVEGLPDNLGLLSYIWDQSAKPYLKAFESDTEKSQMFRSMFLEFRNSDNTYDEAKEGAIKDPSAYLSRHVARYPWGISLAINLGAKYPDWKIDLTKGPLILTPELDQTKWQQCRSSNSVAQREPAKVARYKAVVQNLAPYLRKMEGVIDSYERAAQNWQQDPKGGQPGLESLALLNLVERMTGIYAQQDRAAGRTNAFAKELLDQCGQIVQESFLGEVRNQLKEMADLYFDQGLNKALFEFLKVWDPSDHYYFHSVVANSVDAPTANKAKSNNFDDRLCKTIDDLTRYLSADPATAERVANEANVLAARLAPRISTLADQGKLGSNMPLEGLLAQAEQFLSEVQSGGGAGMLTVLATWNGYLSSWLGTMEGPPTIIGLLVMHFARIDRFLRVLEHDALLKLVILFGTDKAGLKKIIELFKRGNVKDLESARDLYVRTAWRSRSVFVVFAVFGLAAVIYHVNALHDKLTNDNDQDYFDRELLKLVLYTTSDVGNIGLIGLSFKYSRDLKAFIESNMKASGQALTARIASMNAGDWRVATVGVLYKGVTLIGLVLSLWDFRSNWSKSDSLEKVVLFATVAASLGMLLSSIGLLSWLGPPGAVVGFVIAVLSMVYQAFKTGFEETIRALLDSFEGTSLFKNNRGTWAVLKQIYLISDRATTIGELYDGLNDEIADVHWKKPELGYAVEYLRAGITDEALAKIYEMDLGEIKRIVNDQWYALEKYHARTATARIEVLVPEPGVKLVVGALSAVRVVVYDGDNVSYAFLEADPRWYDGDPNIYLTDFADDASPSTYDIERKSVILNVESERTKTVSSFAGNLKLQSMPPGKVARFYVKAPSARTKWVDGRPDSVKAQLEVEFPVSG